MEDIPPQKVSKSSAATITTSSSSMTCKTEAASFIAKSSEHKFKGIKFKVPSKCKHSKYHKWQTKYKQVRKEYQRMLKIKLRLEQEYQIREKQMMTSKIKERKIFYAILSSGCMLRDIPSVMNAMALVYNYEPGKFSSTTIQRMGWELAYMADYITCRSVLQVDRLTLVFDATIQNKMHTNCIVLCTLTSYYVVSLEYLPGGTELDYKQNICNSMKRLVGIYSEVSGRAFNDCYECLIGNIRCVLTNRAPFNHSVVSLLEQEWKKKLVEISCNLHPLEEASTSVKKALAESENEEEKTLIPGKECLAWKIMWSLEELFIQEKWENLTLARTWLRKGLDKSNLPSLHGSRLNVIFHLARIYYSNFEDVKDFLNKYENPNELQKNLQRAFKNQTAILQFKVLAVIDKLLISPWIQTFYSPEFRKHNATMKIVSGVLEKIKLCIQDPSLIFSSKQDFFGNPLNLNNDVTKIVLMVPKKATEDFLLIFKTCLEKVLNAIQPQYELSTAASSSQTEARNLNKVISVAKEYTMVAESVVSEFCQQKMSAPNATINTICNLIKAQRNGVVKFFSGEEKVLVKRVFDLSLSYGRGDCAESLQKRKAKSVEELAREAKKKSGREPKSKKKLMNILNNLSEYSFETLQKTFPHLSTDRLESLQGILQKNPESRSIDHYWELDGEVERYHGEIRCSFQTLYFVNYFNPDQYEELGQEEIISAVELAADFIREALIFH